MQRATAINSLPAFPRASAQSQYLHCIIHVFLLKLTRSIVHYTRGLSIYLGLPVTCIHMYISDPLHYSSRAYLIPNSRGCVSSRNNSYNPMIYTIFLYVNIFFFYAYKTRCYEITRKLNISKFRYPTRAVG